MSKRMHYWSRCTLVATLSVVITFNPVWAGRGLRCRLNKRDCKPVCCQPSAPCSAKPYCECSIIGQVQSSAPVDCCQPVEAAVDCCGASSAVVSMPEQQMLDSAPTPAPAQFGHQIPNDAPAVVESSQVAPRAAGDHSPSDGQVGGHKPDAAPKRPEQALPQEPTLAEPEVAAEVQAPAPSDESDPSAEDVFGQPDNAPASEAPTDNDLFDAPIEPAPRADENLFDAPVAPAEEPAADLFDATHAEQPSSDLFDSPADAPANAPADDLFDSPAADGFDVPATPADAPADDLFDVPTTPGNKGGDDLFESPTTQSDRPSDDLFAAPADSQPATAGSANDPLDPSVSTDRASDDDLFGAPEAKAAEPSPAIPSVDSDDDLFGTPASQPANDKPAAQSDSDSAGDDLFSQHSESLGADAAALVSLDAMRTWQDNTGNFEVQAKLAEIHRDFVRLLKTNGNYCKVPMNRLSDNDRQFVELVASRLPAGAVKMVAVWDRSEK